MRAAPRRLSRPLPPPGRPRRPRPAVLVEGRPRLRHHAVLLRLIRPGGARGLCPRGGRRPGRGGTRTLWLLAASHRLPRAGDDRPAGRGHRLDGRPPALLVRPEMQQPGPYLVAQGRCTHIELGRFEDALALYDGEILPAMRVAGTQLCNAASLLWRLETLGCEAGERWGRPASALAGAAPRHDEPVQRGPCRHDRAARGRQGRLRDGAGRHEADGRREQRDRARLPGHLHPRRRGDSLLHRGRLCRRR